MLSLTKTSKLFIRKIFHWIVVLALKDDVTSNGRQKGSTSAGMSRLERKHTSERVSSQWYEVRRWTQIGSVNFIQKFCERGRF